MTVTAADVAAPLAAYARRFHAVAGDTHHVASPLGAWLLLALVGPASSGADRDTLTEVLGCDVDDAVDLAAALLEHPHPLVPAAAAIWRRPGTLSDHQRHWQAGLPPSVERGELSTQAALDDWARRHTLGLIKRFPIMLDPAIYLILATALATKVSWERPFELAPAAALGPASPWATRLRRVLRTPKGPEHRQFIAPTAQAGNVALHAARAAGRLGRGCTGGPARRGARRRL